MCVEEMWDTLIKMGISEQTLRVVTNINGYNEEALEDILYSEFGYMDFDQLVGTEYEMYLCNYWR